MNKGDGVAVGVMKERGALREATARAERAEAELARLKGKGREEEQNRTQGEEEDFLPLGGHGYGEEDLLSQGRGGTVEEQERASGGDYETGDGRDGEEQLRKDSTMAHLLDSLNAKKHIGHYGRLVFAMVARHFMSDDQLLAWLTRDPDFAESEAMVMIRQVEGRDYNPPKRERILEWQREQAFPILPHPEDPDCGNLYRSLKFPDAVYDHIEKYQEQKAGVE